MRITQIIMATLLTALTACNGPTRFSGNGKQGKASDQTNQQQLRNRAERYWTAKAAEDWPTVFDYQYEPAYRASLVREEFVDWSKQNEPLRVHSYSVANIETDGDVGWVHVHYKSSVRRFPTVEPREAALRQKWRRTDGQWYPVPQQEVGNYPEAPSLRNAEQETKLRARFDESFKARARADWHRLYEFVDPRDRDFVTEEMFAESEGMFEYLEATVHWVEVIEDMGRVQVTYRHKLTDKSMEKLAPQNVSINERWVWVEGEWYRDAKRR